jgi:hypothetical protein
MNINKLFYVTIFFPSPIATLLHSYCSGAIVCGGEVAGAWPSYTQLHYIAGTKMTAFQSLKHAISMSWLYSPINEKGQCNKNVYKNKIIKKLIVKEH